MFKYLNDVPPSDDQFQNEYIDAKVINKLDKTKWQLAGDEMENGTNIMLNISIMIPTC